MTNNQITKQTNKQPEHYHQRINRSTYHTTKTTTKTFKHPSLLTIFEFYF